MTELSMYVNLILAIGVVLIWATVIIMILVMWIGSKVEHERFFRAARRSLEASNIDEVRNGIKNDFEVYRNHRFGFKWKNIVEMCQELGRKMKLEGKDQLNESQLRKLEEIITILQDEYKVDDEKMNEVINNIQKKSGVEDARKLREYLLRVSAYHAGIIYEKDRCFKDMQGKLTKKKWASNLGYILGIIGSIASICSIFI